MLARAVLLDSVGISGKLGIGPKLLRCCVPKRQPEKYPVTHAEKTKLSCITVADMGNFMENACLELFFTQNRQSCLGNNDTRSEPTEREELGLGIRDIQGTPEYVVALQQASEPRRYGDMRRGQRKIFLQMERTVPRSKQKYNERYQPQRCGGKRNEKKYVQKRMLGKSKEILAITRLSDEKIIGDNGTNHRKQRVHVKTKNRAYKESTPRQNEKRKLRSTMVVHECLLIMLRHFCSCSGSMCSMPSTKCATAASPKCTRSCLRRSCDTERKKSDCVCAALYKNPRSCRVRFTIFFTNNLVRMVRTVV